MWSTGVLPDEGGVFVFDDVPLKLFEGIQDALWHGDVHGAFIIVPKEVPNKAIC